MLNNELNVTGFKVSIDDVSASDQVLVDKKWDFSLPNSYKGVSMGVDTGETVFLDLVFQFLSNSVLVSGSIITKARGNCVRCLKECEFSMQKRISEIFFYPQFAETEEDRIIEDNVLDLEQVFLDTVIADIPLYPLCQENCLGLCSECGVDLNLPENANHSHDYIDPRFAELKSMLENMPDEENI